MNSLITLLLKVLEESSTLCGINTDQDRKTILARVESEGSSFTTITLPSMVKDLYKAVDQKRITPDLFAPFKRARGSEVPIFLGGFMELIFHLDGRIRDDASVDAFRAICQTAGLLAKVEIECSPKRVRAALDRYVTNESYVLGHGKNVTPQMVRDFQSMATVIFGSVFSRVNREVKDMELIPSHGPGSVADKLRGNSKWDPKRHTWPDRLEYMFPRWRYAYSSGSIYLDEVLSGVDVPGTEIPVKVITVPKTLKTPRIIAVEPTAVQYCQQGLLRSIYDAVNRDSVGRIMSWESQLPNQQLALLGSKIATRENESDSGFATLDLSDASDLVSNRLVLAMTNNYPYFRDALQACRSRVADVPGHGEILLSKFASMGSAVCFPIEAMVFTTIVFLALRAVYPNISQQTLVRRFADKVRVYGDDIIVPREAAQSVAELLEAYGLRVNSSKSFWNGTFRESCGKEYFNGVDVTYAKLRSEFPSPQKAQSKQVREIVSLVEFRNNLFERGYEQTCQWIDDLLEKCLNGNYPFVGPYSPALGRLSYDRSITIGKTDTKLQVPMVKAYAVSGRSPASQLNDYGALMKTLGTPSGLPNPDPRHLDRAGRPSVLHMKLRWLRAI